ncbi:MauE/DoxX family redox-associated membrane protein [uncultured Chitinophaga sp.]|uniref:MauE/DoxX family redox-associated membrane protein n=1 Tax=uncultured Chitinophaga sp. TaxID=339340 RepID=UPI002627E7EC|nr:MauE/DoxX family redox-associated membrane protein [uncultured Chitinophaga sp.]
MKQKRLLEGIVFFLFLFWIYAAVVKLADISLWRFRLKEQPFDDMFAEPLAWGLPILEFVIAGLMISARTLKWGLYMGAVLLGVFSVYIGMIQLNFFSHVPCSCAGIVKAFGWTEHLIFNGVILGVTIYTILRINRMQSDTAPATVQLS